MGSMNNRNTIKAALTELVLNTYLDIDQVEAAYAAAFPNEDAEVLAECWVEVMEEMPELNQ